MSALHVSMLHAQVGMIMDELALEEIAQLADDLLHMLH
jgi:hypothetical protein